MYISTCIQSTENISNYILSYNKILFEIHEISHGSGADPGFFLGGGALVSCSTSTPINHIVFFLQNTSCIRKLQVISGGDAHPLHPPPRSVPVDYAICWKKPWKKCTHIFIQPTWHYYNTFKLHSWGSYTPRPCCHNNISFAWLGLTSSCYDFTSWLIIRRK